MPRTRAEIQADIDRLAAELNDAVDDEIDASEELSEVLEEAAEVHDDAVEEAADDIADDIETAVEEAAEEVTEESPLTDNEEVTEDDITERVIGKLCERFDLTPRVPAQAVVDPDTEVTVEVTPQPEHWSRRPVFGGR